MDFHLLQEMDTVTVVLMISLLIYYLFFIYTSGNVNFKSVISLLNDHVWEKAKGSGVKWVVVGMGGVGGGGGVFGN